MSQTDSAPLPPQLDTHTSADSSVPFGAGAGDGDGDGDGSMFADGVAMGLHPTLLPVRARPVGHGLSCVQMPLRKELLCARFTELTDQQDCVELRGASTHPCMLASFCEEESENHFDGAAGSQSMQRDRR